jgi:mRNA capping enzyme, catalytic domain
MMYISHSGIYLIDRRMLITRVQLRFPLWSFAGIPDANTAEWLKAFAVGRLPKPTLHKSRLHHHHATLIEGEMVVDRKPDGNCERVFYVYDLMVLNGINIMGYPWKVWQRALCVHASIRIADRFRALCIYTQGTRRVGNRGAVM